MSYTLKRSADPDTIEIWYIWKDKRYLASIIHTDLVDDEIKAEIDANGEADIEFKLIGREQ